MSNLTVRIISALALLPPILFLIFAGSPLHFSIFIIFVSTLAGYEFSTITLKSTTIYTKSVVSLLTGAVSASICFYPIYSFLPLIALFLIPPLSFFLFMFSSSDLKQGTVNSAFSTFGTLYCGALFGSIAIVFSHETMGRYWVFLLLGASVFSDTFAYAFGRLFGKRKMAPSISPGKTWAGAFGGVLGSAIAVAFAKFFFIPSLELYDIFLLGVPLSIFCQLGDLSESFIKRGFSVKDSGKIIPGHGGILDRCDALLFGAPVILLFSLLR